MSHCKLYVLKLEISFAFTFIHRGLIEIIPNNAILNMALMNEINAILVIQQVKVKD